MLHQQPLLLLVVVVVVHPMRVVVGTLHYREVQLPLPPSQVQPS